MKAIIEINLMNLKGTMWTIKKFEHGLYFIDFPYLDNHITLSFLPNQLTII
jgi:hypothetical protein